MLNERENLERLAAALKAQTVPPRLWLIVDTGSDDGSLDIIHALEEDVSWVQSTTLDPGRARGGPIVRAFNAGSAAVPDDVEVIVKLDADVSFEADYFERLLASFAEDTRLGIASGTCLEEQGGVWLERRVTADHVWGACRAYRAACLHEVSPLEERMGWDGIDVLKANARGWRTRHRSGSRLSSPPRRGQPGRRPRGTMAGPRPRGSVHGLPPVVSSLSGLPPCARRPDGADDDRRLAEAGPQARAGMRRRRGACISQAPAAPT